MLITRHGEALNQGQFDLRSFTDEREQLAIDTLPPYKRYKQDKQSQDGRVEIASTAQGKGAKTQYRLTGKEHGPVIALTPYRAQASAFRPGSSVL